MKVYSVETSNIEGQHLTHDIYSSYDIALEAVKKHMENYSEYPDCWKPFKGDSNWWFYGCDSVGIQEYEVKGKLEKEEITGNLTEHEYVDYGKPKGFIWNSKIEMWMRHTGPCQNCGWQPGDAFTQERKDE